jgi:hypothetical protein
VLVPLAVNPLTPADPDAVHEKEVPLTLETRVTSVVLLPEHIVCVKGVFVTVGTAETETVPEETALHPLVSVTTTV